MNMQQFYFHGDHQIKHLSSLDEFVSLVFKFFYFNLLNLEKKIGLILLSQ